MKRKLDWADKTSWRCAHACWNIKLDGQKTIARALRAAELRGFARAVKLLRDNRSSFHPESIKSLADWLEENK